MKNRLEIARQLLDEDGSIFVHIDHNDLDVFELQPQPLSEIPEARPQYSSRQCRCDRAIWFPSFPLQKHFP